MNPKLRELVWRRARRCCEYCRLPAEYCELGLEVDHVYQVKHHGKDTHDNLCLACFYCNSYKGPNLSGIDRMTGKIVPLYHPRRQRWTRHFQWNGPWLVGKTRAGRATIDVLRINEEFAVVVRQSLIDEGVFPPSS